jgi:ABC-2 type transport system ATP-binding protein
MKQGAYFMEKYIIETDRLTKRFGKQIAVNNISLKVKQNVIYGLLGPNGAGKSTTLKLITGLLHPTSGQIIFNGEKWRRKNLEDIGALIETPALYGNLTAKENLEVYIKLLNLPKSRIDEVLEIVDLKNTNKKRASQFSLGMKQRLGIAIALLNHPKLLILDEPTNGLDPIGIQELRDLIKSFPKSGITVILSSHILSEVEQVADYIGIISDGKLGYQDEIKKDQDLEKLFMEVIKGCNSKEETYND